MQKWREKQRDRGDQSRVLCECMCESVCVWLCIQRYIVTHVEVVKFLSQLTS